MWGSPFPTGATAASWKESNMHQPRSKAVIGLFVLRLFHRLGGWRFRKTKPRHPDSGDGTHRQKNYISMGHLLE